MVIYRFQWGKHLRYRGNLLFSPFNLWVFLFRDIMAIFVFVFFFPIITGVYSGTALLNTGQGVIDGWYLYPALKMKLYTYEPEVQNQIICVVLYPWREALLRLLCFFSVVSLTSDSLGSAAPLTIVRTTCESNTNIHELEQAELQVSHSRFLCVSCGGQQHNI